jgi:hypothetical protein
MSSAEKRDGKLTGAWYGEIDLATKVARGSAGASTARKRRTANEAYVKRQVTRLQDCQGSTLVRFLSALWLRGRAAGRLPYHGHRQRRRPAGD